MSHSPKTIYLNDYTPPVFLISTVNLYFNLRDDKTIVTSNLNVKKNPAQNNAANTIELVGSELTLLELKIDGSEFKEYQLGADGNTLKIENLPDEFNLEVKTEIHPESNTALEGLYKSSGMFCTQCEAEGFRRITYFLDQPDVMSIYTTTIEANKNNYPILLSNGNKIESGELDDGRHWVKWHDPFPKPSYLFALVAGDLVQKTDEFITCSNKTISLQIFVEQSNAEKCDHALSSLKKSMGWDEETYGREYDLELFMIVAVNDFNMGAMENKGLNIFNSACVLANPETATDADFYNIESIIGHEYFHNWSGNRVTCRDWFQLSLKEGFTVFRDQEFSSDMHSRAVKRIEDVNVLRTAQFPQDAGPMAHPIRPDSFIDISNFYTVTVYNKGAEVVRMIHNILGSENFRAGTDLYFDRHDGQAVTTEDFVKAMEDASDINLTQFRNWYSQAGTPELHVTDEYDEKTKKYVMNIKQSCPPTPGQQSKKPFHIPLALGLIDEEGSELNLTSYGNDAVNSHSVVEIKNETTQLVFENVNSKPMPSLLRQFSAPVKVFYEYSKPDLRFLISNDSDDFNRWDALQRLSYAVIDELIDDINENRTMGLYVGITEAFSILLQDTKLDKTLIAQAISVPNEILLAESHKLINPDAIHEAREFLCETVAKSLELLLLKIYDELNVQRTYAFTAKDVGERSLKNTCLSYLVRLKTDEVKQIAVKQYEQANNMTDSIAAVAALANIECQEREVVLSSFYEKWKHEPLVIDKWFAIQSRVPAISTLDRVKALMQHEAFSITNPNNVRAVIGGIGFGNPSVFHQSSGETYKFISDQVITLNDLNPQIAARLAGAFAMWKRYDENRKEKMKQALEKILSHSTITNDVYEVVSKTLEN